MSRIEIHIAQIKQELAQMTHDGHHTNFGIETCMQAIDYNLDRMAAINDEQEGRQV